MADDREIKDTWNWKRPGPWIIFAIIVLAGTGLDWLVQTLFGK